MYLSNNSWIIPLLVSTINNSKSYVNVQKKGEKRNINCVFPSLNLNYSA